MKKAGFIPLYLALLLILFVVAYENTEVEEKAVEMEEETATAEVVEELSEEATSTEIEKTKNYIREDLLMLYDLKMEIPQDLKEVYGWTTGGRYIFSPVYGVMLEIASVVPEEDEFPYNAENLDEILDRKTVESKIWQNSVWKMSREIAFQ